MDRQRHTFRANFHGLNTRLVADALPQGKYPLAVNVRADGDSKVKTRPGYVSAFSTGALALTDMRAYATLGTDNRPRILVHDSGGGVWLDDGVQKGTVGTGGTGASFIPYRPNQSPQSWMYVFNRTGAKKFSAPDSTDAVTVYDVGIQEPVNPPEAAPNVFHFTAYAGPSGQWTQGGTAGAPIDVGDTDTAGVALADPASSNRYSIEVAATKNYYVLGRVLNIASSVSGSFNCQVEDVIPAVSDLDLQILSIFYYSGTTGRCVITPTQMPSSLSIPTFTGNIPSAESIYGPNELGTLRRGAIVNINGEKCFVLSATVGPDGTTCFEVTTVSTHTVGETIVGVNAIILNGVDSSVAGQVITFTFLRSALTAGTGTLDEVIGAPANPFAAQFQSPNLSSLTPQVDDYFVFGIQFSDLSKLTSGRIIFDVNSGGSTDFVTNIFYYEFTPSSLLGQVITSDTVYPTNKQFVLVLPITSLIRLGTDSTKTLLNTQGVRFSLVVTGNTTFTYSSLTVSGGGQPDVGPTGSPYFYLVRGRNSLTGAVSNPSPITRYGVSPRRQSVRVVAQDKILNSQMDTWDVFRYGGTVTSFRYIGSMPNTLGGGDVFTDNFFDDSALGGSAIEYDNFQPWPTVDVPFIATAGTSGGILTTIQVYGTDVLVIYSAASAFTDPAPSSILKWLPGTLAILGGQSAYTLWTRPTLVSLASPPNTYYYAYLFQFLENIGDATVTVFSINEPNVANQFLPYVWGPDANGVVFGCGDPLRPGVLYSSKQFNPDSSPNNITDLTPPSEPLLGGDVINGIALVGSSKRWWVIQAAFGTSGRFQLIETPSGRGIVAPNARTTDGKVEFFWAKDGIYNMIPGVPALSLTDSDLANLFPSDGVNGQDVVYGGKTFYAPDYARAAQFRLSVINSMLRAHYQDSNGIFRILTLDMTLDSTGNPRMAWSSDEMADTIKLSYQVEQPSGTLETFAGTAYSQGYLADRSGEVYAELDGANDNGTPIDGALATPEWDMGDARVRKQWLDAMADTVPAATDGLVVTPLYKGSSVGTGGTILQSASRQISLVELGEPIANFLGLKFSWTDDFDDQDVPTQIMEWSAEGVGQPLQIRSWRSVPTSHGLQGYHHIYKIVFAYQSDADVTLTITAYDGTSPAVITLPSTSGAYGKVVFVPTFNKGMLFTYEGTSEGDWAPILPDCECWVGQWQRSGPYSVFTDLGGNEAA